ncbi:TPA: hypothetical protein N0F65_006088 [Lagenidium giganteum]|uniref:Uncharacterized protein n=1 Tax=Lagenidium giganteum TaxID=4803 RepID=A0AAV2YKT7_9STRA|nr:TPA: hypothetical protein N0F65_006088 [Lagenidium giganteum]
MEGIVLIERQSGTLFYNKSFTGRFDLRHPRQERLNLGALLFALHNFAGTAGSSMEPTSDDDASKGTDSRADMTMFDTAEERVVFGLAPRRGLLVALFVLPTMNANVAKSLVHRVATKYDSADDKANEQRTGSLNNIVCTMLSIPLSAVVYSDLVCVLTWCRHGRSATSCSRH